jgi:sulfide:quinone oxidoreductase
MQEREKINRRDAIKVMGVGGTLLLGASRSEAADEKKILSRPASHKKSRIVIVGGGTAGMIAAARARRAAPNAQIVIIAPNDIHLYQSGQLFVAAGLAKSAENMRKTTELLPDGVRWIKDLVTAFNPQKNSVETEKNGDVRYDLLIVAPGSVYRYEAIEGISAASIGKEGVFSCYLNDTIEGSAKGAELSEALFKEMLKKAEKSTKPLQVLFCEPDTPVKGVGTSLSLLALYQHFVQKKKLSHKIFFRYLTPKKQMLPNAAFDAVLKKEFSRHKNVEIIYGHTLKAVDTASKKATIATENEGSMEMEYDYLHITPPLHAPEVVQNSALAIGEGAQKGWMKADPRTLRHPDFPNIFGLGDVIGLDYAKSGGAAQHQGIILQDNIAAALEGDRLEYFYDGYTVAPVVTRYGKVLLAEYNTKKALPTFVLDPYEPRMLWWGLQRYFMPWAYFNLLMHGMM